MTRLDADTDFPVQTGTTITWTARIKGGTAGPIDNQFWLFSNNRWTLGQAWSSSKTFTWRPTWSDAGAHAMQVWARNAGSTAEYNAWKGTPLFQVQSAALQITADKQFPLAPGTTVKWTAQVPDTTVGFQYQFWVYGQSNGMWTMAQPYGRQHVRLDAERWHLCHPGVGQAERIDRCIRRVAQHRLADGGSAPGEGAFAAAEQDAAGLGQYDDHLDGARERWNKRAAAVSILAVRHGHGLDDGAGLGPLEHLHVDALEHGRRAARPAGLGA